MGNSKKQISVKRIIAVLLGLLLGSISFFGFANFSTVPVKPNWGSGPAAVDYFPLKVGILFLLPAVSFFLYVYFSGQETKFADRMQKAFGSFGLVGFLIFLGALVFLILILANIKPG
ncbi:MAG: hypothetical protein KKB51_03545 [Candidatus Riflebacteria bacterium]|nr:hypothetical protein [Candidatus Riflebacteria bacterium]